MLNSRSLEILRHIVESFVETGEPIGSLSLAERLRSCVEGEPVSADGVVLRVTMSLGVAVWDGTASPQELLRMADSAMYRAKAAGRNRVVLADVSGNF